jgi:hypothetical protein
MDDAPNTAAPESTPSPSNGPVSNEELHRVCEEQDRAREALRRKLGVVGVAVDLVREARDE